VAEPAGRGEAGDGAPAGAKRRSPGVADSGQMGLRVTGHGSSDGDTRNPYPEPSGPGAARKPDDRQCQDFGAGTGVIPRVS